MAENILQRIHQLAAEDPRYKPMAYVFLFESLDFTVDKIVGERRHVSGRELVEGIRRLAIEQFGPMCKMVLRSWGISTTQDFGHIVFNLVNSGLMGKTETDSLADFTNVFDFEEAFSLDQTVQLKTE